MCAHKKRAVSANTLFLWNRDTGSDFFMMKLLSNQLTMIDSAPGSCFARCVIVTFIVCAEY